MENQSVCMVIHFQQHFHLWSVWCNISEKFQLHALASYKAKSVWRQFFLPSLWRIVQKINLKKSLFTYHFCMYLFTYKSILICFCINMCCFFKQQNTFKYVFLTHSQKMHISKWIVILVKSWELCNNISRSLKPNGWVLICTLVWELQIKSVHIEVHKE